MEAPVSGLPEVTLQYLPGCPHRNEAITRLGRALELEGLAGVRMKMVTIQTAADADREGFRGSPTVLIDGIDPFADDSTPFGFGCRLYRTPTGADVAPDVELLRRAIRKAAETAEPARGSTDYES